MFLVISISAFSLAAIAFVANGYWIPGIICLGVSVGLAVRQIRNRGNGS